MPLLHNCTTRKINLQINFDFNFHALWMMRKGNPKWLKIIVFLCNLPDLTVCNLFILKLFKPLFLTIRKISCTFFNVTVKQSYCFKFSAFSGTNDKSILSTARTRSSDLATLSIKSITSCSFRINISSFPRFQTQASKTHRVFLYVQIL